MKNKHVVISPQSFEKMDALASNWDMDYKDFLEHIIDYFRVTGEDPRATKKDNMVKAIKQLQHTLVGFIRKHESDHLVKLVQDFEATRKLLEQEGKKNSEAIRIRMADWMFNGVEMKDGKKWSVREDLVLLKEGDRKIIEYLLSKNDDHKRTKVIDSKINEKLLEIEQWGVISTDGNKLKAKNLLQEIKTLINATH